MFDTKHQSFLINILNYMKINGLDIVFKEMYKNRVIAKFIGKTEFTISKWRNNKKTNLLWKN